MDAVAEFLLPNEKPAGAALTILDLGCGTGRFSAPLAEWFGAKVIGVEPSEKMRRQAEANASRPQVTYIAGNAEAIPSEDDSFDAAFLSMAIHHFKSIPDACREIRRVLKPGGLVLLRNAFCSRLEGTLFYEFFPSALSIDEARLPDLAGLTATFEAAGFARIAHRVVTQEIDPSLRANYKRIKLKSLSTFELISDEEFQEGLEAMRKAAEAEAEPKPVLEDINLLVFRK